MNPPWREHSDLEVGQVSDVRVTVPFDDIRFLTFREGRSVSSCPPGPRTVPVGGTLLKYAPTKSPTDLTFQGGSIAPGVPVQLVFWGDWWNGDGQGLRSDLESAVQNILAGPYTSALDQYGISKPSYRGPGHVAGGSPQQFGWSDVQKFIQGLIDGNVFPEPDEDGGRNGYFVMMPAGSTDTSPSGPCGAHGEQVDTGIWGIDPDHTWVAYINNGSLDAMTSCFSHELAELLTDPEEDAWLVRNVPANSSEIGDLCDIRENWLHGVKVRSYWSNRDQACVIPTDTFYGACISGTIDETEVIQVDRGKARPKSPQSETLHVLIPACDFSHVEFDYTSYKHIETASLKADMTGFHSPVFAWSVAGQLLASSSGTITINADVTYPGPGGNSRTSNDAFVLEFVVAGNRLSLTNDLTEGNFDVPVSVSVDEDPAKAAQALNGARTSGLIVSYVGLTIDEPEYQSAVKRCSDAALEFWKATHPDVQQKPGPINPGPLHEQDTKILHELPGWITFAQREAVKNAIVDSAQLRAEVPEAAEAIRKIRLAALGIET
jgi:hypothetical protein